MGVLFKLPPAPLLNEIFYENSESTINTLVSKTDIAPPLFFPEFPINLLLFMTKVIIFYFGFIAYIRKAPPNYSP